MWASEQPSIRLGIRKTEVSHQFCVENRPRNAGVAFSWLRWVLARSGVHSLPFPGPLVSLCGTWCEGATRPGSRGALVPPPQPAHRSLQSADSPGQRLPSVGLKGLQHQMEPWPGPGQCPHPCWCALPPGSWGSGARRGVRPPVRVTGHRKPQQPLTPRWAGPGPEGPPSPTSAAHRSMKSSGVSQPLPDTHPQCHRSRACPLCQRRSPRLPQRGGAGPWVASPPWSGLIPLITPAVPSHPRPGGALGLLLWPLGVLCEQGCRPWCQ